MDNGVLEKFILPDQLKAIIDSGVNIIIPKDRKHLLELAMGQGDNKSFEVVYDIPGNGAVTEATVVKCNNGVVVNYMDMYMRRRDPDCMVIADDGETDKARYRDVYGEEFESLRNTTFDWLKQRDLIIMPFILKSHHFIPRWEPRCSLLCKAFSVFP